MQSTLNVASRSGRTANDGLYRFDVSRRGWSMTAAGETHESAAPESTTTIVVAIAVNVLIATCKGVAAAFTGSSAMLSEAIHSSVDALNEALLFLGVSRGKLGADAKHPLGYGQELYFWTLIVAVVIFGAGGSVSIFEGITRLIEPRPIEHAVWNYAVLGVSIGLESISWIVAYRALRSRVGNVPTWRIIRESKDPTIFTVLLEDTAALIGLVIALTGTLVQQAGFERADGIASIGIGVVLCAVAFIVVRESRGLIIGESASPAIQDGIRTILSGDRAIARVASIITLHVGPDRVLVVLSISFVDDETAEISAAAERIRAQIRSAYPIVATIAVDIESLARVVDGSSRRW